MRGQEPQSPPPVKSVFAAGGESPGTTDFFQAMLTLIRMVESSGRAAEDRLSFDGSPSEAS